MRTIIGLGIIIPLTVVIGTAVVLAVAVRLPRSFVDVLVRFYFAVCLTAVGARVTHIERDAATPLPERVVLIANHESHLDMPAVVVSLDDRSVRGVAKEELARIPFFGWAVRAAGNVIVTRTDTKRDIATLDRPAARARDRDVMFFAEGTRSRDGSLGEFKKGAFAFAIAYGRPIVPIGVAGGFEILPPESLRPKPGPIALVVGTPIPVAGLTYDDRERLRDQTRAAIVSLRARALELVGSTRT